MIALPVAELARLGKLRPVRTRSPASRSIPAASCPAISSSRWAPARRLSRTRGETAPPPPSSPTTRTPPSRRIGGLVRDRSGAQFVAITGSMGKTTTKDILAALCRPHVAHRRRRVELQQRDRRSAHALPRRAGHRGVRARARDARLRPDRGALRVLAARDRRDHLDRARPSREGRHDRGCPPREERAARGAAARRHRDRARRLSGEPGGPRCRPNRRGRAPRGLRAPRRRRRGHHVARRDRGQLHDAPPRRERGLRARRLSCARAAARPGRRGRLDDRVRRLAKPGAAAPRRRPPDQRRVERQPGLDARGARAPARAGRRPPHGRRPRRDGRARRLLRGGPPRGRPRDRGGRDRRRRLRRPAGPGLRRQLGRGRRPGGRSPQGPPPAGRLRARQGRPRAGAGRHRRRTGERPA